MTVFSKTITVDQNNQMIKDYKNAVQLGMKKMNLSDEQKKRILDSNTCSPELNKILKKKNNPINKLKIFLYQLTH